jgi:transposase
MATTPVRMAGIDDWSWRKGSTYGAIVVDLERREVVDMLPERSAAATVNWLRDHSEVEYRLSGSLRPVRPGRA